MSSVETLADQAFQLSERDRADLAYRLLRSLEPAGEEVTDEESQAVWAAEIKARSDAVHAGTAELLWMPARRLIRSANPWTRSGAARETHSRGSCWRGR